jgi:ComF family protein
MKRLKVITHFRHLCRQGLLKFSCCDLCGENVGNVVMNNKKVVQSLICQHCFDNLPFFNLDFLHSNLLSWPAINRGLPKVHFDCLLSLTPYISPLDHWLRQFKYQGRFELATLFSALLSHVLTCQWDKKEHMPELVLSVPLHISKWQIRGYNQAHLIADKLAKKMRLPYQPSALERIKKNDSQVGKTGAQRRNNLRNSFAISATLPAEVKHVLLVDDVITTGSTASEISKLLKKAGIEKVTLVTVCLSLPKN